MCLLECLEFEEQRVESAQVLEWRGVDVQDRREGEAQEEIIDCAAAEFALLEVRHALEVGAGEVDCVEPVDAPFVAVIGRQWWVLVRTCNIV